MSLLAPSNWLAAAEALAGILKNENDALQTGDFAAAASCLPAKRAAIQAIECFTPGAPKQISRETLTRLDHLAAENRRLLKHSIKIQSQVLSIIAGAARAASAFGYASSGKSTTRTSAFLLSAKA